MRAVRALTLALLLFPSVALGDYASVVDADSPCYRYHLGESSGTTANDTGAHSGNCTAGPLNWVYQNSPTLHVTGIPLYPTDGAVSLAAASSQYVESSSGDYAAYGPSQAYFYAGWTAEGWFYPTDTGTSRTLLSEGLGGSFRYVWSLTWDGALTYRDYDNGGSVTSSQATSGGIAASVWHHIVVVGVGDGPGHLTDMKIYLDGAVAAEKSSGFGNFSSESGVHGYIGSLNGGAPFYNGAADEVAYWRTALTGTQVLNHFNAGISSGLFHHRILQSSKLELPSLLALALPWRKSVLFKPGVSYESMSPPAFGSAWEKAMDEGNSGLLRTHRFITHELRPDSPFGQHAVKVAMKGHM
jgi:hypothetical protein